MKTLKMIRRAHDIPISQTRKTAQRPTHVIFIPYFLGMFILRWVIKTIRRPAYVWELWSELKSFIRSAIFELPLNDTAASRFLFPIAKLWLSASDFYPTADRYFQIGNRQLNATSLTPRGILFAPV